MDRGSNDHSRPKMVRSDLAEPLAIEKASRIVIDGDIYASAGRALTRPHGA